MRMPIDESRQHEPSLRIDRLRTLILRLDIRPRTNSHDRIPAHRHTPILIDRARPIHRDHDPAADDQVDILLRLAESTCREQRENKK